MRKIEKTPTPASLMICDRYANRTRSHRMVQYQREKNARERLSEKLKQLGKW